MLILNFSPHCKQWAELGGAFSPPVKKWAELIPT